MNRLKTMRVSAIAPGTIKTNAPATVRVALLGMFLITTSLSACSKSPEQTAIPAVPVKVQVLQADTVKDSSEFVGTLEAAEQVELKPETQGRIAEILVRPGDRVEQGTPILVLTPDQSVPQLEGAEAAVGVAQSNRSAIAEQLRVAQENLEASQANLASAQASRDLAETNLERARFLVEEGAIGQFDFDRARTDLEIKTNQADAAQDQVEAAQASVAQARAAIGQANANVQQSQAQARAAAVSVSFRQILSPIAGVVGDLPVKVGDFVSTGTTLTRIVQNGALDLRISVPSNRLSQLRLGLPVELIDPSKKESLGMGAISFISPTVDSTAQVVLVKAQFLNSNGTLRNGQYTEARIIWDQEPGVLIPTSSVLQVSGKSFVFVAENNPEQADTGRVARMRPVELGAIQGQKYQVIEGLQPGENLVVSGILRLKDGVPIQAEP